MQFLLVYLLYTRLLLQELDYIAKSLNCDTTLGSYGLREQKYNLELGKYTISTFSHQVHLRILCQDTVIELCDYFHRSTLPTGNVFAWYVAVQCPQKRLLLVLRSQKAFVHTFCSYNSFCSFCAILYASLLDLVSLSIILKLEITGRHIN